MDEAPGFRETLQLRPPDAGHTISLSTSTHEQTANRFAIRQAVWATEGVVDFRRGVETEAPVDRRGEVAGSDGIGGRVRAEAVARAVDMAAANAAAREEDGVTVGPVIAACGGVDRGRATELAHRDDERRVEQPTFGQVIEQRGQCGVGLWQQEVLVLVRSLCVSVPVLTLLLKVVDVDERDARFDQSPREQHVLTAHGSRVTVLGSTLIGRRRIDFAKPVTLAQGGWFLRDVERLTHPFRVEQPVRLVIERTE